VNFFTPKLMRIRWSSLFFGSFAPHFQIKLSIQCSNLKILFVDGGLDFVDLVKLLEKNQKLHISIVVITLKVTSCRTMSKKK
jgi:hypothetical protein